jgi:hypothetical protein
VVRALLRTVRGTVRGLPHLSGVRSGVSIVGFQGVPGCRGIFVEIDIEGSARGGVLRIQSHNTAGPATLLTKTPGAGERPGRGDSVQTLPTGVLVFASLPCSSVRSRAHGSRCAVAP